MAGGITDRKEEGFVLFLGLLESFLAPGIPIHRVVGVLEKIGALFADEPVRFLVRFLAGRSRCLLPQNFC
jgi:hypothetical protein